MKKTMGGLLMTSTLLLGSLVPLVANAAENQSGTTNATATFTANTTTPVTPVDPTDPTTSITPGDGDNGAAAGTGLSLIYAPSTLDFGSHEIDVTSANKYAASFTGSKTVLMGTTGKVGLQVSDARGTNAGWTLTVNATDGTSGNLSTLKGATVTLPAGTALSTGNEAGTTADNGATVQGVSALSVGGATETIMSAADTKGAGITSDLMDSAAITLNVAAATASAKTYTGQLNWSLASAPVK